MIQQLPKYEQTLCKDRKSKADIFADNQSTLNNHGQGCPSTQGDDSMTKQQYVDTLITLCRLTNLADVVDHPDHAAWLPTDYSRTHCNAYYDLLKTMLNADQLQDFINGESVTV